MGSGCSRGDSVLPIDPPNSSRVEVSQISLVNSPSTAGLPR